MGRSAPRNNCISEANLERWARLRAQSLGGRLYKWVSPGFAGVMDRILTLPGDKVAFLEFKNPLTRKKPTPRQQARIVELESCGCTVGVICTKGQFEDVLRLLCDPEALFKANRVRVSERAERELATRQRREQREIDARTREVANQGVLD